MLGFKSVTNPQISKPPPILNQYNKYPSNFVFKSKTHYEFPSRFNLFAQNSKNDSSNNISKEPNTNSNGKDQQKQQQQNKNKNEDGSSVNGDDMEKDRRPVFNLKWGEILNPDPDNIFAVGLTGLLTWASVQVLWQLLTISLAILVAALKYSFIAALLLFILITLL